MNADKLKQMGIDVNKLVPVDLTSNHSCDTIKVKRSGFWNAMQKQKHYRIR